jgi:hypothetical protein
MAAQFSVQHRLTDPFITLNNYKLTTYGWLFTAGRLEIAGNILEGTDAAKSIDRFIRPA